MPLVPPYIESLQPYKPGKPIDEVQREFGIKKVIKLASNENPIGASPLAIAAIQKHIGEVNFYPNGGYDLRVKLAKLYNLKIDNVIVGNGSDGIMSFIIRTFLCDDDEVLTTESAFIGFQVLARSRGIKYRTVPYRDWHYDLPALAKQVNAHTKIVYLANPNNPTGTIFSKQEFDVFYKNIPERTLIILDEAYFEYAQHNPEYPDSMQYRYDNVITLRTFSKIYGLAGLRLGYGFAHKNLITNLMKVKLSFEPNLLAQAAGIAALDDRDFVKRAVELNNQGLRYLPDALRDLHLQVIPSHANFVTIVFKDENIVNQIYQGLLSKGIIVRPLKAFGLPHCIRVTVGTMEQNQIFIGKLKELLRGK
ncbi:MAG: histidinol-phosphate transaminase [Ignavibacteriales bacterium]|nr:histidinol-phosphate transaminase [Ignavibacteriales bacterium]